MLDINVLGQTAQHKQIILIEIPLYRLDEKEGREKKEEKKEKPASESPKIDPGALLNCHGYKERVVLSEFYFSLLILQPWQKHTILMFFDLYSHILLYYY